MQRSTSFEFRIAVALPVAVYGTVSDRFMRETVRPGLDPPSKTALVSRSNGRRIAVARTVNKHIRLEARLWERLEAAARDRETSANRLLGELALEWLENREWPATEVQVQVARSSLFTAQAMARNLAAENRGHEIEEISRYVSTIVPDATPNSPAPDEHSAQNAHPEPDDS